MTDTEVQWGVAWDVAVVPDELLPVAPTPPTPPPVDLTEQLAESEAEDRERAYGVALAEFADLERRYRGQLDAVLSVEDHWDTTVAVAPDEDTARVTLAELRRAHTADLFARNFRLVTSPPRVWTLVEG